MSERGANPGPGLGEWLEALDGNGFGPAAGELRNMVGGTKAEILEKIENAGLPVEPHIQPDIKSFVENPDEYFAKIPESETYFVVFEPGVERAVGVTRDEAIEYVNEIDRKNPGYVDFYLSGHDCVFAGGISVDEIGRATGNFVLGQYNELSSGQLQPDLTVTMNPLSRPEYRFSGIMGGGGNRQDDRSAYLSETGREITKEEMTDIVNQAIFSLPRDGSTLSAGWYELKVLEHKDEETGEPTMYPYFIKAIY